MGGTDLLLILIGASLIFNGALVLQRRGLAGIGFLAMLAIDLAFVVAGLYVPDRGFLLVLAVGGFGALVVVPAILGVATRRAVGRGDYARAMRLLAFRQHLQPGFGLERERQMLAGLALVTQGRGDEAIRVARRQLADERTSGPLRRMILERLLTLLLVERRFDEAFEVFDAEGGDVLATVSPGICMTMARAYGEVGRFDEATRYQALIEESSAAMEPPAAAVVNGARLSYLANLGRVEALEAILDADLPVPGMTRQRRRLFFALALSRRGRVDEGRALWLRVIADETEDPQAAAVARERLREPDGIVVPEPLPDTASILVEIVTARAGVYKEAVHKPEGLLRVAPMTVAILASLVGIHALVALGGGGPREPLDPWVLLRYGANFSIVSLSSEPWRLVASMFLHANLLHLGTNAIGLYMLGRFTEQVFGSWRTLVIYAVAGLAGSVTSATMSSGLLSVGASGAIFGLLGAALVGLHGLRGQVPDRWRRQLTINLVIVVGLQVLIGFRFTMIDNAAHLGGLLGGVVTAWVLGFRGRDERGLPALALSGGRVYIAFFLSIAFIAVIGASAWMASQESVTALLAHIPDKRVERVGLVVRVPQHWYVADPRQGLSFQDPLLTTGPTFLVKAPETIAKAQRRPLWRLAGEIAKAQVAALRQRDHAIDVQVESRQPRGVAPDLMCVELHLKSGAQVRYHLIYVKLRGDVLLVMHAMLPSRRLRAYLPSLDQAAMSAWLKGPGRGKLSASRIRPPKVSREPQGV